MPTKGEAMSVVGDQYLQDLLDVLHAKSDEQAALIRAFEDPDTNEHAPSVVEIRAFRSDKLVALDRDKAEFCYQLCRAKKASTIIEVGTSYGVSTIYLAAAVRDNVSLFGGEGVVIGTEYEPNKAAAARANFAQAGLGRFINLREGDLRETLKQIDRPIDFVLMDVWIAMARPAIELIAPHLSDGAVVVCDNTKDHRASYADYFAFLNDPVNGFTTMTLPFQGGLELSVRC
jgi:predicted O-methyltransferase YrrM